MKKISRFNNTSITSVRTISVALVLLAISMAYYSLRTGDKAEAAIPGAEFDQPAAIEDDFSEQFLREHGRSYLVRKELAAEATRKGAKNQPVNPPGDLLGLGSGGDALDPFTASLEDGYTRVEAVATQADGKVIAAGSFPLVNGVVRYGLVRLNPDGTIDQAFNAGSPGPNGDVQDVEVLPNGKIMIAGFFNAYNGTIRRGVARLLSDGTLDTTFNPGGGPSGGSAYDVLTITDGRSYLAGNFTQFNGQATSRIIRLNPDGSRDTSFTAPAMTSGTIQQIVVQPGDAKVIFCGSFNLVGGITRNGIARVDFNGALDSTFDPGTATTQSSYSAALQADGKILVGAAYTGFGSLVRLNPNGTSDPTFAPPSFPGDSTVHSIIVLADGKILIAGFLNDGTNVGYGVVKLLANGSLDTGFTPQQSDTFFLEVFSIALTPSGKIAGGGDFYRMVGGASKHVQLLNPDGSFDPAFGTQIIGYGEAYGTIRQPDGKVVVAGSFRSVNGTPRGNIVRLNVDGSIDPSFIGFTDSTIMSLTRQTDGKLLIGGQFFEVNGVEHAGAMRLNSDGSTDAGFNLPANLSSTFAYRIIQQPDGKLLGFGLFGTPAGNTGFYRVNSDGSLDPSFVLPTGWTTGSVTEAALQSDGKILIGGNFNNVSGGTAVRIARLNQNGTLDTGFTTGTGANNIVWAIAPQTDGKVMIGGSFSSVSGQYARGLARLNSNGSVDNTLDSGLGVGGTVYDIVAQPNGSYLVGGFFTSYNGMVRRNIARLNNEGTLDSSFTDQCDSGIRSILHIPSAVSDTYLSGAFRSVNGVSRGGVALLRDLPQTAPANDNFAAAELINGVAGNAPGSNSAATAQPGEPAHAGSPASHSIWYRWVAPGSGLFSFTTSGSSFDTTLGVYTGTSVASLTEVSSNDDSAAFDTSSRVVFRADAGTTYYIAIDGKNNSFGLTNLIWRQAARTYRLYAQTGNGNVSPRIPTIVATRVGDGLQFFALSISPGVFELDLPVDNATYNVTIGGADTWSPNSFVIDNSSRPEQSRVVNPANREVIGENPNEGGVNVVVYAVTVSATVSGELAGLTSTNGVSVALGSELGPNPIAPIPCAVAVSGSSVGYSCQFIVDTRHQIKPTRNGILFAPVNRRYNQPVLLNLLPGPDTLFTGASAPTYNITGTVSSSGTPINQAAVFLTGFKTHSFITATNGAFQFPDLPSGGDYMVRVEAPGYTFAPQNITNLQSNQVLTFNPTTSCSYSVTAEPLTVGAAGGANQFSLSTAPGCPWSTNNSASWLTVNNSSGSGPSNIYFTAQPNVGMPRSGTITVGGQTLAIQQVNGCTYTATVQGSTTFPATGGSGTIDIGASDGGCVQTPTSNDYCMVNPGSSTTGSQPMHFTIGANTGVGRTANIFIGNQTVPLTQSAAPGTHRTPFDFEGDGRANIALFRPSNGTWYVLNAAGGGFAATQFGFSTDKPVAADYDGDGVTDIAVWRPESGIWYIVNSSGGFPSDQFGLPTDIPVPADYDGDGKADLAVFRPSAGDWYWKNSSNGATNVYRFGQEGDKPVPADYDGDGKANLTVFRPSNGIWFVLNGAMNNFNAIQFGASEDNPVPADYDGDRIADIAIWRPSIGDWYRINSTNGAVIVHRYGLPGDIPVPADYTGDHNADLAIYRPSTRSWFIWSCTNNVFNTSTVFGLPDDIPVANRNLP